MNKLLWEPHCLRLDLLFFQCSVLRGGLEHERSESALTWCGGGASIDLIHLNWIQGLLYSGCLGFLHHSFRFSIMCTWCCNCNMSAAHWYLSVPQKVKALSFEKQCLPSRTTVLTRVLPGTVRACGGQLCQAPSKERLHSKLWSGTLAASLDWGSGRGTS